MRKLIIFLLLPSCLSAQVGNKEFSVTLKLDYVKAGEKFYLEYKDPRNEDDQVKLDSLVIEGDKVEFKGTISDPLPARIYHYKYEEVDTAMFMEAMKDAGAEEEMDEEGLNYMLNPIKQESLEFFLMEGQTTIKVKSSFAKAVVEGPAPVNDFARLKKQANEYSMKAMMEGMDFMNTSMPDSSSMEKLMKKMDSIQRRVKDQVYLEYVRKNPASPIAVYALQEGLPHPVDSADKYLALFSSLSPALQEKAAAKKLQEYIIAAKTTEIGRIIPDFQQWDSLGKAVNFYSFKGKYVLIELWASWCGPCRKKNPGLVKVYDKYSKEKFTILGVALEQKDDKAKWLKAIQKDQLKWPQLTDFKYWNNAVARQWGVKGIPFNILVDPNGKILGKNLYGKELDDRLAELFKK